MADELFELLEQIADEEDIDLYLYSGGIDTREAISLVNSVETSQRRTNAGLFLCTGGGDPDAAYTIAKCLKRRYEKFTLYIFGYCKSAGTLIALGADEIVMSAHGELGPLDVQLVKRDELLFSSSGLDLLQAMDSLRDRSLNIFENHFLEIIERSGGAITTKTSADIASRLTGDILAPIMAQIDPLRLGEVERALLIAYEYGKRLNSDEDKVQKLIRNYPSHSFVIDYEEADEIFGNVRQPTELECQIREHLSRRLQNQFGRDCLRLPLRNTVFARLNPIIEDDTTEENDENEQDFTGEQPNVNQEEPTNGNNSNSGISEPNAAAESVVTEATGTAPKFRAKNGRGQKVKI